VVSTGGAGYDTVNVKHCTDAGVLVVNQTGGNKQAVAEHVVALMLMLSKRIMETDRNLRRGTLGDRAKFMGNDVFGKTVGIIGLGNVGGTLAKLCNTLLQMTVLAYDPYLTAEQIKERGAEKVELDDLLRRSDFVSTNCPLTDETRNLVGAREYALMKPTAFYINAARGFIHDEAALADVLRSKRIAGAGLDVWAKEPPGAEHPLIRQRHRVAAHRRRHRRGARQDGPVRRRPGARPARRPLSAAPGQSRGLAGLRQAVRKDLRVRAAALTITATDAAKSGCAPGRRGIQE
jgi:D-3-phosphoglycerate dehydrogenase